MVSYANGDTTSAKQKEYCLRPVSLKFKTFKYEL